MPKRILTRTEKAELCASMVVKAAHNFNYLGVGIEQIGVPPPTAVSKTCRGHGIADFCVICNFNRCRICGSCSVEGPAFWSGECAESHEGMKLHTKHTKRVMEIVNAAELPGAYVAKVVVEKPSKPTVAKKAKATIPAKKAKATTSIHLNRPMTVGATSAKVVRNKRGGWTLKLSVELADA